MKIESVETILADDKWLLVKVITDNGIEGIGEAGLHGVPEAALAAVKTFARYLVGQDPLKIEHHFQFLYRFSHFRGASIMGALNDRFRSPLSIHALCKPPSGARSRSWSSSSNCVQ